MGPTVLILGGVLALGLVLAIEGLVLALAPSFLEKTLRVLTQISLGKRRAIGLGSLAAGIILIGLSSRVFFG